MRKRGAARKSKPGVTMKSLSGRDENVKSVNVPHARPENGRWKSPVVSSSDSVKRRRDCVHSGHEITSAEILGSSQGSEADHLM